MRAEPRPCPRQKILAGRSESGAGADAQAGRASIRLRLIRLSGRQMFLKSVEEVPGSFLFAAPEEMISPLDDLTPSVTCLIREEGLLHV